MRDVTLSQSPSPVKAQIGAAPTPTAVEAKPTIASDGLTLDQNAQKQRLARMQNDLAQVIAQSKWATPAQGAEPNHWQMMKDIYSEPWMFHNATTTPPRDSNGAADVLTRRPDGLGPKGSTPESRLRAAILSAKGPLEPAAVLKLSLQVNGNDYFLANLAAHNVLKDVTSTERRLQNHVAVDPTIVKQDQAIENQLVNLRPTGDSHDSDKMGPWYHLFAIGTIDATNRWAPLWKLKTWLVDEVIIRIEHIPPGGCDRQKEMTDEMMTAAIREADRIHDKGKKKPWYWPF